MSIDVRRRLRAADPQPGPPRATPADERLLAAILATGRARRRPVGPRLFGPLAGAALIAAALATGIALVRPKDAPRREVEAVSPGALPAGAVLHLVTRVSAPGDRVRRFEGWVEPSTGRARIVERGADGKLLLQETVAGIRVRRWTRIGRALQAVSTERSASLAAHERRLVADRFAALVSDSWSASDAGAASASRTRTRNVRYAGQAAIELERTRVVRLAVTRGGGHAAVLRDHRQFARIYRSAATGAPLGLVQGVERHGARTMVHRERVVTYEVLGRAAVHRLNWQATPALPTATPTPDPLPTATPTPTPR
jgi:hypothetical protein